MDERKAAAYLAATLDRDGKVRDGVSHLLPWIRLKDGRGNTSVLERWLLGGHKELE